MLGPPIMLGTPCMLGTLCMLFQCIFRPCVVRVEVDQVAGAVKFMVP